MNDKRILIYDFEVFSHDWMVVVIDFETKDKTVITNDVNQLRHFYAEHKLDIWVGYNSRTYDQYILKGLLLDYDPYYVSTELIANGRKGKTIVTNEREVPLYNFDISTGFHSLKQLEGFMGSMIKESDVPFDIDRKLTAEELAQTEYYCTHDVEETLKVFEHRREEFDSQISLIEAFDLPFDDLNRTKAQLAARILGAKRRNYDDEYVIRFPDTLRLEKYKYIQEWFADPLNQRPGKSLCTEIAGVPHVVAWGGLHGCRNNFQYKGKILCADVASLYPSIMIEYGLLSRNVRSPELFKQIRDTRLELKKAKDPRQLPYKIVLNSTYGASGDPQNALFDPRMCHNVCVTGQLLLIDLIEHIEPYCDVVNTNTDGVYLTFEDESNIPIVESIMHEWEARTRLTLEIEYADGLVQKDVNNYILIEGDAYKSKGAYVKKLKAWDYDLPIVNKALIKYFINGTPVEETIQNCNELIEFQKIIRITSLYKYAMLGDERIKEKVLRVYASSNESAPGLLKVKEEGKGESIAYTPERCFIFNGEVRGLPCPAELDKEYYVNVAQKRLSDFLDAKSTSKNNRVKSGIKYIGYTEKEAIDNLDFSEFSSFTEFAVHLMSEGILDKRQLGILIELNYFADFGNERQLLMMFEQLCRFEFGERRSIKKEALEHNAFLYQTVEENSVGTKKDGKPAQSFTQLDTMTILTECERRILKELDVPGFTWHEKIEAQKKHTGDVFPSGKEYERPILLIEEAAPALRRKDKKQFGVNVSTVSLGSGKRSRFTIFSESLKLDPVGVGDVIRSIHYDRSGGYLNLHRYVVLERAPEDAAV